MRTVVHDKYGAFDVLSVRNIERPAVKDDEVLVRVRAAGLHIGDCFAVRGAPFAMRLVSGLIKPKHGIPGFNVAGHIEAVGTNIKQFRQSDEVFGSCNGACAE